jgi:glycerol-3-phosphate dehydrogenase
MAEKAVDVVAKQLNVNKPCTTAQEVLLGVPTQPHHQLTHRLHQLEKGDMPHELICECELVTRVQLEEAIKAYGDQPVTLDDLRRDLRLGMGPCQGGFCSYRAAGILRDMKHLMSEPATQALAAFVNERFEGTKPLLWGHHLRQFYLDEMIYRRTMGLDQLEKSDASS